jgi:hypothetical protein
MTIEDFEEIHMLSFACIDINMMDILTTPSMAKPKQDYSRTPGQVLSLISSLGFVSI